jgi:hypothetical protein
VDVDDTENDFEEVQILEIENQGDVVNNPDKFLVWNNNANTELIRFGESERSKSRGRTNEKLLKEAGAEQQGDMFKYYASVEVENHYVDIDEDGPNDKHICWIVHDESNFYSNNASKVVWTTDDDLQDLWPESQGRSLVCSGFCCPCHGFFEHEGAKTYKIITPGKNADAYWTIKDLVEQLKVVMSMFAAKHPNQHCCSGKSHVSPWLATISARYGLRRISLSNSVGFPTVVLNC